MPTGPDLYRDFYYPLNVFMHILTHEEGEVTYLHYGLFEKEGEPIGVAQERSTKLLLSRLPPPPASVLDVGTGLGTTLRRLQSLGYDAEGITPDEKQIAVVRARHGDAVRVHASTFESFAPGRTHDVVVFQESSQYIDSEALFARAEALTRTVIVLDEFALQPLEEPGALHSLQGFLEAAQRHGFKVEEELDLTAAAAPTPRYFIDRFPAWRTRLVEELGVTSQQIDDLVTSGERYVTRYRKGVYGYRLLRFARS